MASRLNLLSFFFVLLLLLLFSLAFPAFSQSQSETQSAHCGPQDVAAEGCYDTATALRLKLIAIASILLTSTIGVCLPIFSRSVPALHPDRDLFSVVKAFSSGVILATGYMHVLPDSFNCLTSPCLPENPWRRFPFTTFVAMLSALLTLMVDSFSMSYYRKRFLRQGNENGRENGKEMSKSESDRRSHGHEISTGAEDADREKSSQLLRHRVVAQVLEMGIVVHSVVIGLSMGASENTCTIRPLIAALCFHQLFEGMGLGGCILQAEYGRKMKAVMVFFFSITTPVGIALGIGVTKVYSESSPAALIVVGLLNASSAGLLNYMALVDLLASDFMAPKLQSSFKLQLWAYAAVFVGAGGMSVMAIWA